MRLGESRRIDRCADQGKDNESKQIGAVGYAIFAPSLLAPSVPLTAFSVAKCGSAPLVPPVVPMSSRSPSCFSNGLLCSISFSRTFE